MSTSEMYAQTLAGCISNCKICQTVCPQNLGYTAKVLQWSPQLKRFRVILPLLWVKAKVRKALVHQHIVQIVTNLQTCAPSLRKETTHVILQVGNVGPRIGSRACNQKFEYRIRCAVTVRLRSSVGDSQAPRG